MVLETQKENVLQLRSMVFFKAFLKVAVITVYFFRVFGSTFHKYTKIYSILLGVHQPLLHKFSPVELPLPKVH